MDCGRLELFWHDIHQKWCLYRRKHRSGVPSEDQFVLEWIIQGPDGEMREPGGWMIAELRQKDVANLSSDPEKAHRKHKENLEAAQLAYEATVDRKTEEMAGQFAKDFSKALRRPKSIIV